MVSFISVDSLMSNCRNLKFKILFWSVNYHCNITMTWNFAKVSWLRWEMSGGNSFIMSVTVLKLLEFFYFRVCSILVCKIYVCLRKKCFFFNAYSKNMQHLFLTKNLQGIACRHPTVGNRCYLSGAFSQFQLETY